MSTEIDAWSWLTDVEENSVIGRAWKRLARPRENARVSGHKGKTWGSSSIHQVVTKSYFTMVGSGCFPCTNYKYILGIDLFFDWIRGEPEYTGPGESESA